MVKQSGPFRWAFTANGSVAPYLAFLNLREPSEAHLPRLHQTAIEHPSAALDLLIDGNWRPHVVAAIACYLGDLPGATGALWRRFDQGSWAGPQLAAALSLLDPNFLEASLLRLADSSLSVRPLLALLREDHALEPRVASLTTFDELTRSDSYDSYDKSQIATTWRSNLLDLACAALPQGDRYRADRRAHAAPHRLALEVQTSDADNGKRSRFFDAQTPMSRGQALSLMSTSEPFRRRLSDTIYFQTSRTPGRWETPPMTLQTMDEPFEYVLVPAPELRRTPDHSAFAEHFADARDRITTFPNLSRTSTMIVPTPHDDRDYAHLGAFLHTAPWGSVHALWKRVAQEVSASLNDQPLWLSTAGLGVPWLHLRIDRRPKYYAHAAYRDPKYSATGVGG